MEGWFVHVGYACVSFLYALSLLLRILVRGPVLNTDLPSKGKTLLILESLIRQIILQKKLIINERIYEYMKRVV